MLNNLSTKQSDLANYMSEISERCYAAGWEMGLEFNLWYALINGLPIKYGQDLITENDIIRLKELSEKCNCWIFFNHDKGETAIDISDWNSIYDASKKCEFSN